MRRSSSPSGRATTADPIGVRRVFDDGRRIVASAVEEDAV